MGGGTGEAGSGIWRGFVRAERAVFGPVVITSCEVSHVCEVASAHAHANFY